jgi:hypothetical protein
LAPAFRSKDELINIITVGTAASPQTSVEAASASRGSGFGLDVLSPSGTLVNQLSTGSDPPAVAAALSASGSSIEIHSPILMCFHMLAVGL